MSLAESAQSLKGRKGAVIALGVVAVLLLLLIAAPIILLFAEQQQTIDSSLDELATYKAEVERGPAVEQQLAEARQRASGVPGLIDAGNASLAQAKMQTEMESLVGQTGGSVRSAQIIAATRTKGFEIIAIQYDLLVPASRLRDLIYAIESHTPYFFIDSADIAGTEDFGSGDPASRDPSLAVHFILRGYRWVGAK